MEKDKENNKDEISETNQSENLEDISEKNTSDTSIQNEEENGEPIEEDVKETEEEKLKEEIKTLKEEKIRVLAEMENLRKRLDREKVDFARDILSPGDNLERALSAINKEEAHPQSIKNLIEGLLMVKKELSSALEKNGITKIDTLNSKFDPNLHQAMMEIENNDLEEGVVVQEIQTGYMMYDRLLRPAMVGVSKKTKQESETAKDQDLKSDKKNIEKDSKN